MAKGITSVLLVLVFLQCRSQHVFWSETFDGTLNWTLNIPFGFNGAYNNSWNISDAEAGVDAPGCGFAGNSSSAAPCLLGCTFPSNTFCSDQTLHITSSPLLFGPCSGAAYAELGLCSFPFFICSETHMRAEYNTAISTVGYSGLTLSFDWIGVGQPGFDYAELFYSIDGGGTWIPITTFSGGATCGQGLWATYSTGLPAACDNQADVRFAFEWRNNDNGVGNDPSFAVDDMELSIAYVPSSTGIIVNELSNGPSLAKEYLEFLVVGAPCTTVDLRGWIFDDNNGRIHNGFSTIKTSSGVAAGHLRFANIARWSAVPTGSLIVIYNQSDINGSLPANDVDDTSPTDSVYVLPANDAGLERCTTAPISTGGSSYRGCGYAAGSWNSMGLRNAGDAGQIREPNGVYFHGISYGSNANNMTGGLDNLKVSSSSGTGRVFYFIDTDYRDVSNFAFATVGGNETPGTGNNAANQAYIDALKCPSGPLPVELMSFHASYNGKSVDLEWATASEIDNDYFTIESSPGTSDGVEMQFTSIGTVQGAGNSNTTLYYQFTDYSPPGGVGIYRLKQTDYNGDFSYSRMVKVFIEPATELDIYNLYANPDEHSIRVTLSTDATSNISVEIVDVLGRSIYRDSFHASGYSRSLHISTPSLSGGIYLLKISDGKKTATRRFKL